MDIRSLILTIIVLAFLATSSVIAYYLKHQKETVDMQAKIDAKNKEIAKTDAKLKETEETLAKAKKKSEEQYDAYKERFRVMCEDGTVSYIALIFSSESLMDFVNNIEIAKEISEYDKRIYYEKKNTEKERDRT